MVLFPGRKKFMGNKRSSLNYPRTSGSDRGERRINYNTPEYYRANRSADIPRYGQGPADMDNYETSAYDRLNRGKYEDFGGEGYYGSRYGYSQGNMGRDYEQNAGYRESYDRLPEDQWPEVEEGWQMREAQERRNRQQESHRGKGPRSWRRPDDRLMEEISDALYEDPGVDASDVEVSVDNGDVILTGFVEDRYMKRHAADIAEEIPGVTNVENRLRARVHGNKTVNVPNP